MCSSDLSLNLKGKLIHFQKPIVMAILNITPDSFYDGGINLNENTILKNVATILEDGADIIDIGAMSSRPFSKEISESEEIERIKKYLPLINYAFPNIVLSIDTYRSQVARYALDNGVSIINDISAGRKDEAIFSLAKEYQAPFIIMHMQGSPESMQTNPQYDNIFSEILFFLNNRIEIMREKGIKDIIIDVGFGFGKSMEDNYRLIKNLNYFSVLNYPILAGISRKSMIYRPLNTTPQNALNGTSALHFEALRQGAKILRVHDVKEAKEIINLHHIYQNV